MNLSQKAKRAVASGLALSTLVWSAAIFVAPAASAAPHGEGCLVNSGGTVYLVSNGQRRGFTSAEVFASHGYNFGQVVASNAETDALPVGPIIVYADGSLVKGPNDPLVYLVSNGQKRGFVSGSVFTGLGYSFANIQWAPVNTFQDLPTGSNVESATERHPAGTWVIDGTGTVWMMTATGRMGLPSMEVFNSYGKSWAHVVAANAADLAAANEGIVPLRTQNCAGSQPQGPVSAALAPSNPAAGTLVAGQAQADLAHFMFSGSGTINSLTFERIGVSANTTPSAVYLFNGASRVSDSASVSSDNKVTFAGLNIGVPSTLSVKSDIAGGTAGQTVGMRLVAVNGSSVSVSGNIHNIATATLASVAMSSATGTGNTDPANDINVWQGTVTVGTRNVVLNRLALRQIGSISSSDIKNFRLLVDGVQVAAVSGLDSNGYVTFAPNTTINTGARTLRVMADIVGGSSRTVQMSLRGAYDITTTDTSYNAQVLATGTFPFGPAAATIASGTMSVLKATDSASGNVTLTASDVSLGKFTLNAFGEAVKVETLSFSVDISDNTVTSLRNGRVMINGTQYGSTANLTETSTGDTDYTVNYTVQPGAPATVEVRADMVEGSGTALATDDTVQLILETGSSNGVPQVSLSPINVPTSDVSANSLTVKTGTMSMAQTANYGAQSTVSPKTGFKIASYQLSGNSTEAVNVTTFDLDIAVGQVGGTPTIADVTDVYIVYGGSQTSIKPTVSATGNIWSPSFTLGVNETKQIDVYASFNTDFKNTDTITATLEVSGTTASSAAAATTNTVAGQVVTISAGSITASLDASTPAAKIVDDSGTVRVASYRFVAANDSYIITDVNVSFASASAANRVYLKDGSTTVGDKAAATDITFSGLEIEVPANTTKVLDVEVLLGTVGAGAGATGADLTATLDVSDTLARNSQGTSAAVSGSDAVGNAVYVYKAIPTLTAESMPSTLTAGTQVIAKFTVTSNGGPIAWKEILLDISKSAAPTITAPTLWDVTDGGNSQVTAAVAFQNGAAGVATTCVADNTTCELLITVGTKADDNTEQQVSGSKTYEVRATIGGTLASGNYISTQIASNLAHVASGVFTAVDNDTSADDASFTWSDMSATAHDTGTSDWVNENLVMGLPLSFQTRTVQ